MRPETNATSQDSRSSGETSTLHLADLAAANPAASIRQGEVLAARRMIERFMERFDLYPASLMGDSAYGSAEMLG